MKASAVSRDTFCFCEPGTGSRAARRIWPDRSSQTVDASPGSLELSANEAPRLLQELPLTGIVQARRPRLLSSRILRCLNSTSHLFSPTAITTYNPHRSAPFLRALVVSPTKSTRAKEPTPSWNQEWLCYALIRSEGWGTPPILTA